MKKKNIYILMKSKENQNKFLIFNKINYQISKN